MQAEFQAQVFFVVVFFLRRRGESGEMTALPVADVSRRRSTAPLPAADTLRPCLLSPESDRKQGKRGERVFDCRRAPEAARRAPVWETSTKWFKKYEQKSERRDLQNKSLTTTIFSFAKRLLSCRALKSTEGICHMQRWGLGFLFAAFCTFMQTARHQ